MSTNIDTKQILSDLAHHMKYAKYIPEKERREIYEDTVYRNRDMHIKKFPKLKNEITKVYDEFVLTKKILPSMRSMQFAGKPIEVNPTRIFNCSFLNVDDWRAFNEIMFLLLSGCFEPTTEVKTKSGNKQIKDVTIDDLVMTYDIDKDEYNWVHPEFAGETLTASKAKIRLTLDSGKTIECTTDHEFFTTNRGWVEAKDLTEDDDIQTYDETKLNKD